MQTPTLDKKWRRIYLVAKILLYILYLGAVLFVISRILFPMANFTFSFANSNSLKNTLLSPRLSDGTLPKKGIVDKNESLAFNANSIGLFSKATVTFALDDNNLEKDSVLKIRHSYQAFFAPTGNALGFRNGTLLENEGSLYIISENKLRKFYEPALAYTLGFQKNSFLPVTKNDLAYNEPGEDILNDENFPMDTLIQIGEKYYKVSANQSLIPFVSSHAFLSQYDPQMAIQKNPDFLNKHAVSDSLLVGFADGTLASSDQSVYVLSDGKSYPVADAETFLSFGYSWDDVLPLTPEELGAHKRQKQFDLSQMHPNGTIFFDTRTNQYFLFADGQKNPIESQLILKQYLKEKQPVRVDSASLENSASCKLTKKILPFNTLSCDLDFSGLEKTPGNDFLLETTFGEKVQVKNISLILYTPLTQENLKNSLVKIKARITGNYL